jgi:cell wall-associated NlpC family hydrolase
MAVSSPRRTLASLIASTLAIALAGSLTLVASSPAQADPTPSLAQVRRQVDVLRHQAEQAAERFNTARVELTESKRRMSAVRSRYDRQQTQVDQMRDVVGKIAAAAYKSGAIDPTVQLVLSEDPTTFLRQAADMSQLSRQQAATLREMAAARLQLAQDRKAVRQERARAGRLKAKIAEEKQDVEAKLASTRRLLGRLEAEQRAKLAAETRRANSFARASRGGARDGGGSADAPAPTYDGPASGRAAEAVRTAYAQLGDPYVYGAAGPSSFDCSGLTMYSWAAAGVSLPHSSSAQYSAVRHVSMNELQPGDLVFYYSPISHVGIYIGGGTIIDAPYPGLSVHISGLYSMPVAGAGRP